MSATNQNQKMTDFNYKKYSLEKLEEWIHDAMTSGEASAQEIYNVIHKVVEENYYLYKNQTSRAYELLALLNGNGKSFLDTCDINDTSEHCKKSWNDFWNDTITFQGSGENGDGFYIGNDVNKWILPVEIDGASGEYYVTLPDDMLEKLGWKEGDTIEYVNNKDGTFSVKKCD